jgi:hydrogenase-4 component F
VTELVPALVWIVPALPCIAALALLAARTPRQADRIGAVCAPVVAAAALVLAAIALARGGAVPLRGAWYLVDGASGLFLAVIAVVGCASALLSREYLRTSGRSWVSATRSRVWYYAALYAFWAALLAVPIVGNLGLTWLLVEATTATSALLVAFSGRRDALEAGWKYLVLTTLGLSVALLGIVVLAIAQAGNGRRGIHALDWHALERGAAALPHGATLVAFVLILAGLATKIGWAPVHNWLPDAHSEAPAPVSALLSAALLPTVMLVAWRVKATLDVAVGGGTAGALFIAFGLASMIVAVPFLWRSLPWKRLLAYSSLEHMGVLALGIGIGHPLAIAGVVLHVAGHALAKALGFYAALRLVRVDPAASGRASTGVAARSRTTALAMGVSLVALGGVPPSPLFVSELLIVLGAVAAGQTAVAAVAVVALALGFLGLAHALLEAVVGEPGRARGRAVSRRRERPTAILTGVLGAGLLGLCVVAVLLPGSEFVAALARGAL